MIKKIVLATILTSVLLTGCFSGPRHAPSKSECRYQCSKCGRRAFMLNSVLKNEACPEGGRHNWCYNLNR